ncbi:hypothetical protein DPMN_085648 [Dreissena polymorpha]|uniref:Uncharacterized protein n=1 Tax=Dreissena polymorpha TaxID=45954 RepID=A0A9D3YGG2_DREPO|nr:hypothetical protein DPMN_085648 [Dreissena polymorpha]
MSFGGQSIVNEGPLNCTVGKCPSSAEPEELAAYNPMSEGGEPSAVGSSLSACAFSVPPAKASLGKCLNVWLCRG